jgi:hypothetical protein
MMKLKLRLLQLLLGLLLLQHITLLALLDGDTALRFHRHMES